MKNVCMINSSPKKTYFSNITVKNIYQSFTHKMAAKASCHRNYVTVTICIFAVEGVEYEVPPDVDGEQQQQQQHDESESAGDGTSGVRAGQDDDCDADINQCSEVQHDDPQPAATENAQPLEQDGGETLQRHSQDGSTEPPPADCVHTPPPGRHVLPRHAVA